MGSLTLPDSGLVYLDASPVIYSVEKIEPYWNLMQPVWSAARAGNFTLVGSELLLLETLVKPIQNRDSVLEAAFRQILTASREVQLVPITASILERAARLRAQTRIKTPDAIHAATALTVGCSSLLTNDKAFKQVPDLSVTLLGDVLST